jgi:hypothetical protein
MCKKNTEMQDNSHDYKLYDVGLSLSASKHVDWKRSVLARATVLMNFLKSKSFLIDIEPFDNEGNIKTDLLIKESNLNDKGLLFFDKVLERWERYLDRGGKVDNVAWLEKWCKKEGIIE